MEPTNATSHVLFIIPALFFIICVDLKIAGPFDEDYITRRMRANKSYFICGGRCNPSRSQML